MQGPAEVIYLVCESPNSTMALCLTHHPLSTYFIKKIITHDSV